MILAIVLSAIVLIGWSFLSEAWLPTAREPSTTFEKGEQVPLPQPQAFQMKAPRRVTEKFTQTLAGKLEDRGDESPRFVVLTELDGATTSVQKARKLPARIMNRLSASRSFSWLTSRIAEYQAAFRVHSAGPNQAIATAGRVNADNGSPELREG